CLASVVLPDPGRPQMRINRASDMPIQASRSTDADRDDFAARGTLTRRAHEGCTRGLHERGRAMKTINLGVEDGLPPVDWSAVVDKLNRDSAPDPDAHNARTKWLTTINEDGSPHVTAVGAIWLDGAFWFQTGSTRKGRNVARDPRCSIALSIRDADVVIEGDAAPVTDPPT